VTGAGARRKGLSFERWLAARFRAALGVPDIRRGLQTRDGAEAADVEGVPGWWVEAKAHRRVNLRAALVQALAAAPPDRKPVVIGKDDRQRPVALMLLDDFITLIATSTATTARPNGDVHEPS
jgi:hypothetical protein